VAKMLGFYSPEVKKVDLNLRGQSALQAKYASMNDKQLLALIAQGAGAS
jgi:hypothetical protein